MSEVKRTFRKNMIGGTHFRREHMRGSIHAYHPGGKGKKWENVSLGYAGEYHRPNGSFSKIKDVEQWALGVLRKLRKDEDKMCVIWDNREHLFMVESPYWNAGTWTQDLNKAKLLVKKYADEYKQTSYKIMTVKEAREMLAKSTYVTRRII